MFDNWFPKHIMQENPTSCLINCEFTASPNNFLYIGRRKNIRICETLLKTCDFPSMVLKGLLTTS